MNLYLFNATDSAAVYGIGTYLKELTNALEDSDINIHVVHLHSVHPEFEIVKKDNIEYWHVPDVYNHNTFTSSMQKLEDYCRNVIYLLRLYIKDTKDLVFHINYNHYQFFAKELKTAFDCKTVATVHFTKWALELQGNLALLQTILSKPDDQKNTHENWICTTVENESLLYKEVDQVIALAHYTKNILHSDYQIDAKKISVIPNGLDDIGLMTETDKEALRKKWLISEKEFIILYVGRLHEAKGIKFLFSAFRQVLNTIPECRLMIVGSGEYGKYMKEVKDICTRVTFTGLLEKQELYDLCQISDIGVLPSLTEQCSYVVIEMLMLGLAIITTSAPGLEEMTKDEISSLQVPLIVNPERVEVDTDLMAEKIVYLLEHPEEAKRLGENARKRYEDCYSKEIFRKNMCHFYRSLYE